MARPKLQIDVEMLKKHAAIHCTMEEMASLHNCSVDTLENRFSDVIADARCQGKMSLRRKQFEVALQGSVPMLVWCGKQYLDQRDKKDIEDLHFKDKHEAIQKLEEALAKLKAEVKS